MDSSDTARPNVEAIKGNIQQTIHSMEMSYGTTGSLFRSGSRQTFFATQVTRYAWGRVCNCILEFTNWNLPDMQISMQLQSSTCFTTLHSTCSEVSDTQVTSKFCENILQMLQPLQCYCRTSPQCRTRHSKRRGCWPPGSWLPPRSWPTEEARWARIWSWTGLSSAISTNSKTKHNPPY